MMMRWIRVGLMAVMVWGLSAMAMGESQEAAAPAGDQATEGEATATTQPSPQTMMEQFSYGLGVSMARDIQQQEMDVDAQWLAEGILDALQDQPLRITQEQAVAAFTQVQQQLAAEVTQEATENMTSSEKFLEANAQREGVTQLPSGLQYEVLAEGDGPSPKASDTVRVNYRGTLIDGTEFDASERHGGPAEFRVDRVIAGWTEALQLMKVGDRWRLFIPAKLAYGEQGAGRVIGPNQTLIFDVELLGIQGADAEPADATDE